MLEAVVQLIIKLGRGQKGKLGKYWDVFQSNYQVVLCLRKLRK